MTFSGDIFLQMCLKRNPPKNVGTFRVLNLMFLLLLLLLFSRFLRCRHRRHGCSSSLVAFRHVKKNSVFVMISLSYVKHATKMTSTWTKVVT